MQFLSVGRDRSALIEKLIAKKPERFLIVDDGPTIELLKAKFDFHPNWRVTEFDHRKHSFNIVKDSSYRTARDFTSTIKELFDAGSETLTKETGLSFILHAFANKPLYLDRLISPPDKHSTSGHIWAHDKVSDLLFSPVLKRVFNTESNLSFSGTVLLRLNRAELGDFDCLAIALFAISRYKYTVVIPDFGFYGRKFHTPLIRQNRLIAGVNYLDETPLKKELLLIKDKTASQCLYQDAVTLGEFANLTPDTNKYNAIIESCIERSYHFQ